MKAYLFDIDGTLADCSHRIHHINGSPKDWRAFFAACEADKPIPHIIDLARVLHKEAQIVFVSGRSMECLEQTAAWMLAHDVPPGPLYMRAAGDHRPDNLVKSELLDAILADGYRPAMVFDDRNSVVKMWRERGIPCLQVAEGDF